ncbi:krab-a domain-containing, partial [Brachionus plicatilis]
MKINYDRNVKLMNYNIGDKVWLLNSEIKKGKNPKLSKSWKGHYEVLAKITELTYKIKQINGKKKLIVNINRIKKCFLLAVQQEEISLSQEQNITINEDGNDNNLDSPRLPSCDAEKYHHIPEDLSPMSQVMPVRSDSEDLSPSECNQFAKSENRAVILPDLNNKNLPTQKKKRGRPRK